MDKTEIDFDEWFMCLVDLLADDGISFSDADAVKEDFESGKSVFDVVDEIKAEHAD